MDGFTVARGRIHARNAVLDSNKNRILRFTSTHIINGVQSGQKLSWSILPSNQKSFRDTLLCLQTLPLHRLSGILQQDDHSNRRISIQYAIRLRS
mmetsp:Transcript_10526/g.25693  ORF Transcript_10526/g.25693 Transcript_10526/m.25693 type:complete len:95 (-) Transcript_10526:189-473(-)